MTVRSERIALPAARLHSRWLIGSAIAVFSAIVLIPTWLVLPPDDEDLFKEVAATVFQSRELFDGRYPFWDPSVAFGTPQPLSQTLVFHPFLVLAGFLPVEIALGAVYQLQLLVALFAVWAVARHLGLRRWVSALCVVTFALSSPTIMLLHDFWPVIFVQWTLAPLLLLLLLKLLDAEDRRSRALYSVGAGLCAALMLLDGHAGVMPDLAIGFAAFLAARFRRVREIWPWLGVGVAVFGLASASRLYDIAIEDVRSVAPRDNQEIVSMDWWRLFLYPIRAFESDPPRTLVLGGPFLLLAVVGLVYRGLSQRHVNGFRAGAVAGFALWFLPGSAIRARSGNIFAGEPFILFAIFLAGLALQTLWSRSRSLRPGLAAAVVLQVAALTVGFYPFYRANLDRAQEYLGEGKHVTSLPETLKNLPIYRFFEQRPDHRETRAYMAPGADDRLFRTIEDYEFAGWSLHGLRLVNGIFKGVEMKELEPPDRKLKTKINGDARISGSGLTLDVLNVGYVLATADDRVAAGLRKIKSFQLADPDATIDVYRNPTRWPDAVALRTGAKSLERLPPRPGCTEPGLLCADFSPVASLRVPGATRAERWNGTTLDVDLEPAPARRVLMVSQLYRPGWRARLSNGREVHGYRLLGGFTGFDIPPGVSSARVSYRPIDRIALTALTWFTLLAAATSIAAFWVAGRRQSRPAQPGAGPPVAARRRALP